MEESGQSSGAHSTVKVVENPPGSAVVPATPAVDTPPVVPATPAVTTTPVVDPEVPVTPPVEGLTPVRPRPTDEPLLSSTDTSKSKPAFVVNPPEGILPKTVGYSFDVSIIVLFFERYSPRLFIACFQVC